MNEFSQTKGEKKGETENEYRPKYYILGEDGKPVEAGPEIIPVEEKFDFGDLTERLNDKEFRKDSLLDGSGEGFYLVHSILEQIINPATVEKGRSIPLAIEVGKTPNNFFGMDLSEKEEHSFLNIIGGVDKIIDVNICPLKNVKVTRLRPNYIQVPVEKLSSVFKEGHRANFIYLSRVLTRDNCAVIISGLLDEASRNSEENKKIGLITKEQKIIRELSQSLMSGGIVVIDNNPISKTDKIAANLDINILQDKNFGNFEVLLEHLGGLYVLRKKED